MNDGVQSGLEGVVAFATEIAEPDRAGGALRYRGVDIEERRQRRLELLGWRLVQHFRELDQRFPGVSVVFRLDVVDLFVLLDILTEVLEPAASTRRRSSS